MPLRNILAIPLALALGQVAWAQTPTGHPEVQYKDAPDFGDPSTGGSNIEEELRKCLAKATSDRITCRGGAKGSVVLIAKCEAEYTRDTLDCNKKWS